MTGAGNRVGGQVNRGPARWERAFRRPPSPVDPVVGLSTCWNRPAPRPLWRPSRVRKAATKPAQRPRGLAPHCALLEILLGVVGSVLFSAVFEGRVDSASQAEAQAHGCERPSSRSSDLGTHRRLDHCFDADRDGFREHDGTVGEPFVDRTGWHRVAGAPFGALRRALA